MSSGRLEWGILLAGLALLYPIQRALDEAKGPPPNVVRTLPPRSILSVFAAGHRETMADLLEIRATNFVLGTKEPGVAFTDEDRDHLWALYDGILTLDPNDADAALRGAILMGAFGNRADACVALAKRALGEPYELKGEPQPSAGPGVWLGHPRRWKLYREQAATHLILHVPRTKDPVERARYVRRAGELLVAANQAGGPVELAEIGEEMRTRGLSEKRLLEQSYELWKARVDSPHESIREEARGRLVEIQSSFQAVELNAIAARLARGGAPVRSVEELEGRGVPAQALEDPLGVGFRFYEGRVVSPGAMASELRRRLEKRYVELRSAGQPQTREAVLQGEALPPFLRVELQEGGVGVSVVSR